MATSFYTRRFEPFPLDYRHCAWRNGTFNSGRRDKTKDVEGVITLPHDLLLVTIAGSARLMEVKSDCGHRYKGGDFSGSVSFVPAGCSREVRMRDVQAEWASISLRSDLLDLAATEQGMDGRVSVPTFTNIRDPFLSSLAAELRRLHLSHDRLDPAYCTAMSHALAHYLIRRHGSIQSAKKVSLHDLPSWRVRRITDYIEANLACTNVADLAEFAGVSIGHLHRAFRASLGVTPLNFINQRRIERARHILATDGAQITEVSMNVGFTSPSHFAHLFRRMTGVSPSEYRNGKSRSRS